MRSSARSLFTTIRTEGAILPSELLERIAKGKDFDGLSTDSYHILAGQKLNEVIERSWKQAVVAWRGFKETREKSGDLDATGTSLTRERWLYPLFQELGFGRMPAERKAREIDGREYAISHFYDHVPVHMVGYKLLIDRRTPGIPGAAKTAPHSLVQEFLNRTTDHLWAIVSNGLRLRLLRDNKSLTRQAYVEFDLEAMMEGDAFADFRVLWLLCHQSRFEAEKPTDCWLEKWSKIASEQGVRALDKLRGGVEEAIRALGKGFLAHPANHRLRSALRDGQLDRQEYYRQLLRVVYRLLFLFVAEDRDLLLLPELQGDEPESARRDRRLARARYQQHYGTQRLRSLSQTIRGTAHPDLWRGLQLIMRGLGHEGGIPALAVPALGSYLWSAESCPDLAGVAATPAADIANADLLTAVRALAVIEVEGRRTVVNYAHLRSEELGSVYESLLELHPNLNAEAGTFDLHSAAGNERKTTGSYYTPDSLVQCLLDSALEPVMDEKEALAKKVAQKIASGRVERSEWPSEELDLIIPRGADPEEALAVRMVELLNLEPADRHRTLREAALLGMRVCDPACGSGHFLIAAAHRVARRVARVRTGDEEPAPESLQHAMRDVVGRCLYGVDINPMALELAKVALWMEAVEPGKPLGFLDAHFQCGNALLGTTPELIAGGLPDGAFTPLAGDDKKFVSALKKRNKQEREGGQQEFLTASGSAIPIEVLDELSREARALFEANADSLTDVQRIAANYQEFRRSPAFRRARFVADLWCAAFVWPKVEADEWKDRTQEADGKGLPLPGPRVYPEPPTHDVIQRCVQHPEPWKLLSDAQRELLERLGGQFRFTQWHVLFADVFRPAADGDKVEGGFDCMLGNPPWERVKPEPTGFFAAVRPEIATAQNASVRDRLLVELEQSDPHLFYKWSSVERETVAESLFLTDSGRYPKGGNGKFNLGNIFVELCAASLQPHGTAGLLNVSGMATDDSGKELISHLMTSKRLVSFFDFENKLPIFPEVHSSYKFSAITITGDGLKVPDAVFVFYAHRLEEISDPLRRITLSDQDIRLLNPISRNCPIFRANTEAEIVKQLYRRAALLEPPAKVLWRWLAEPTFLFVMSDHSTLFSTRTALGLPEGDTTLRSEPEGYLRLYESKMFHQFNHRWAALTDEGKQLDLSSDSLGDPYEYTIPRYFMKGQDAATKLASHDHSWLIGVREVARATDERTVIASCLPKVPVGHNAQVFRFGMGATDAACFLALLNSYPLDFAARTKIGGAHLSSFILRQLPLLGSQESSLARWMPRLSWGLSHVLELTFTAWDLEPFARDCGYDGPPLIWDEERRFQIRAELDAAFFHLYLGTPEEWTRTGSPELLESFPTPRHAVDYIMETFPIVKRKDEKAHGTYRTKLAILDIYDQMAEAIRTGQPYQTALTPPPGPPTDAEGNFIPMALWNPANWPKHIHKPKEGSRSEPA